MSEQAEHETDAGPTPGPWQLGHQRREVFGKGGYTLVHSRPTAMLSDLSERQAKEIKANARLIAAAGTAAHEAREMGYDPVKAVEALPELLAKIDNALETLTVPASAEARINDVGKILEDALTKAEGRTNE